MQSSWMTHQISNQFDEKTDYHLLQTDPILQEILQRYQQIDTAALNNLAQEAGSAAYYTYAELANRHPPMLHAFDARGRRLDSLEFHPAWHKWMALSRKYAVHAYPFASTVSTHAWVDWAARFYMAGQIECGNLCPSAMTLGSIPLLQREEKLWQEIGHKLLATEYDARDVPISEKKSIWIGMGMTEKQGGSDVRANQTFAIAVDKGGRGQEYRITGHKWFFSAPMCDAHLVVAQTENAGLGCFYVPRWRPDGRKNTIHVQRLKNKVGNRSNSSSEVEFHDAFGIMLGEEGRGIPTIIEMAAYTRLTCSVGSAAIMRQALVQSIAYTRQRQAFGQTLAKQPLMQSVLCDLALESEAATQLSFFLAASYQSQNPLAQAWARIMTPAAKFWICKRAIEFTGETMEVFGGNGYVDDGIMARLFKEAPVNSIWEGSGNVMCLDVLRAIQREPESITLLLADLAQECRTITVLQNELAMLQQRLQLDSAQLQAEARYFVTRLSMLCQAVLMLRYAPNWVANLFIQSRYHTGHGHVFGELTFDVAARERLLVRALPH